MKCYCSGTNTRQAVGGLYPDLFRAIQTQGLTGGNKPLGAQRCCEWNQPVESTNGPQTTGRSRCSNI